MWNLKNNTNESIYKAQIDSQTQKINLWLPKRRGRRGGINQENGINKYLQTTICEIDQQQGFTVQHRELYSISYNDL